MKKLLLGLALLLASVPAFAQNPVSIAQVGTTPVTTTVPVSGTVTANQGGSNWSINFVQLAGGAVDTNSGNKSAGTLRVTLATDQVQLTNALKVDGTGFLFPSSQSGTWTMQPGNTANTTPWLVTGSGTAGAAAAGVLTVQGIASMTKLLVTPDSVALPANQSVNVSQINGVTPLMGNGVTGTGSQRVTIASDNTAFAVNNTQQGTAAQNVTQFGGVNVSTGTGASGTGIPRVTISNDSSLAANQSVNVAQMNGVAVTMGAGATGTGVQRTNDVGTSATGAAPPASAHYIGGLGSGATGGFLIGPAIGDTAKAVNISTATTTLLVTGVSGRQVHISAMNLVTAAANNVALIEGTGATCGTGSAGMAGGTTSASGWNFGANGGLTLGSGVGTVIMTATTGDSVCVVTSATTQLSGSLIYAIY